MSGESPVFTVNGFVVAVTKPVVEAVGNGAPQGKVKTCQVVAVLLLVHPKVKEVVFIAELINKLGFGQVGGGAQVIFDIHPGKLNEVSLLNRNVKHPFVAVEVNGPGILVPQ